MTDDKKPAPTPKLVSIRFREGVTLDRLNAVQHLDLTAKQYDRYEVAVVGASVFIRAPGQRLVEVPRSAAVLSYEAEGAFEEVVRAASGGKRS